MTKDKSTPKMHLRSVREVATVYIQKKLRTHLNRKYWMILFNFWYLRDVNRKVASTNISLASFLWYMGKQCRPRSDAALCIGSPQFAYRMFSQNLNKDENNITIQQPLKRTGTDPIITTGNSIRLKWVNLSKSIFGKGLLASSLSRPHLMV